MRDNIPVTRPRAAALALALALLLAACSSGGSGSDASAAFCDGLAPWYEAQRTFLDRTVAEDTREGPRFVVTYEYYQAATRVPLPEAGSRQDEVLLALVEPLQAAELDWILALRVRNVTNASTSSAGEAARKQSVRAADEARRRMNAVIDQTNAALRDRCDLSPFPTGEPASP